MIMDDSSYHLNWDRHLHVLSVSFSGLIAKKQYSDVTICTDNGSIPAHRIILSSCSLYFKALFDDLSREHPNSNHPIIVVKDIDYETMIQLLKFMYVGAVDISKTNLDKLLKAATSFRVIGMENVAESSLQANEDANAVDDVPEDVQGEELDLSRNGPSRQYSSPATPASFAEERSASVPKLLAPQKAHLNPTHTPFAPFDNTIFTSALAMRSSPQYLSASINSPSRPNVAIPNLPKQSPHKSRVASPKRQSLEALHRDSQTLGGSSRRFSNSPDESANSNASLDLTKASTAGSPLNRLTGSVHPLSSLVSVGHTPATQADFNPMSVAIATKLQQFQQMQQHPQIRVSQSLLSKRSRSRSPESIVSKMAKVERHDRDLSPGRYPISNRGNSPHDSIHSNKQTLMNNNNSSGGSSSEQNNYSDDDSGDEGRADEHSGRDRSVSPGPSTSTSIVTDGFNHAKPGYGPLPWNYPPAGDDSIKQSSDAATGSSGFWKNSFKNSLLGPYLTTSLPSLSPGTHTATLSPTFPGLYPPTSLSTWGCNSSSPPSLHSIPFLRSNECARCGRLYKTRKGLKHHIKNECGVEPRFQCTRCDWKFKQKAHLLRHMARKHTPPLTTSSSTSADPPSNGASCLAWKNQKHAS